MSESRSDLLDSRDSGRYDLLDRLAEEFIERFRRGERPSLHEYTERNPALAEEIRGLFPALVSIERVEGELRDAGIRNGDAAPSGDAAPPPRRVGDFEIIREIGRGGMGVVYEAEQVSLGRRVALKILSLNPAGDASSQERFRREARAAARLHHTNIVPVFEVGQDGDVFYYAMQFIEGQGLDVVIAELRRLSALPRRWDQALTRADTLSLEFGPVGPMPPRGGAGTVRMSQVSRSLLTGQFSLEGWGTDPGDADRQVEAGAEFEAGGPSHRSGLTAFDSTELMWPGAVVGGVAGAEDPGPPAAPSESGSSASISAATLLNSSDGSRRPYYLGVARIGRQAADALAYAHERGIIHRDIKPSNLLLDTAGVVWITDFGLAKADDDGLTHTGDVIGTFRYMAPERFRGEGDERADVYALGLTLYELLILRPAFLSPDRLRLMEKIKNEEPIRPRAADPRIPRDLETIVLKAIEKDPRDRYATAAALGEDLRRFIDDEPIQARRTGRIERLRLWCRRNQATSCLLAAVAAAVALAFGGVTWGWLTAEAARRNASDRAVTEAVAHQQAESALRQLERNQEQTEDILAAAIAAVENAGSSADALAFLRKAVAYREAQVRRSPGDPEARSALTRALDGLGVTLARQGRFADALDAFRRAIRHASGAPAGSSHDLGSGRSLATALHHAGLLERRCASDEEAARTFRQAIDVWKPLADAHVTVPSLQGALCREYECFAACQRALGRADEAEQSLRLARGVLERLPRRGPDDLFVAACVHARSAALIDEPGASPTDRDRAEWRRHVDLAVQSLRQAIAAGYRDATPLKTNPDLAALRNRDDFREIVARLEGKAP